MIEIREVIITNLEQRGRGERNSPIRRVCQIYDKDGTLLAEKDPIETMNVLTSRDLKIMNEAFTIGRVYANTGEKESPTEIQEKLEEKCLILIESL